MSKIHDGGPAFPACNEANVNDTMGMSLRDWFAGRAISGIIANPNYHDGHGGTFFAREAYMMADAMLAARDLTLTSIPADIASGEIGAKP